ncbi:MAG: hypothetical protein ACTSRE_16340 [Promethearchaeota archaeon]
MPNGGTRLKFTHKEKVIIFIVVSSFFLLTGAFIPLNYFMYKSYKLLRVTDIEFEKEPVSGVPIHLTLMAEFPVVIDTSMIRTVSRVNRQMKQLHIWIAVYHPYNGGFMAITYTNETVQVVFPLSGTWDIIAGEYSMEIFVS